MYVKFPAYHQSVLQIFHGFLGCSYVIVGYYNVSMVLACCVEGADISILLLIKMETLRDYANFKIV